MFQENVLCRGTVEDSVCLFVFFFFLNWSPALEEQQRKLCRLFLWLDLLEFSLFKGSLSLRKLLVP